MEYLADSIDRTVKKLCGTDGITGQFENMYDGVLIMIDEADNASPELNLGSFLKRLTERLQILDCYKIIFGLAGHPRIKSMLRESHQSSLRLFEELYLKRLSPEESIEVVQIGLEEANSHEQDRTEIDSKGLGSLVGLSEGFPHFIQQFAYSAFAHDTDNNITDDDVWQSAVAEGGALDQIGSRFYHHDVFQKIQTNSYREVLIIMANRFDDWWLKSEIRETFSHSETTLSSALKTLHDRKIIIRKEGVKGVYRLQNQGFAVWLILQNDPGRLRGRNFNFGPDDY